MSNVPDEVREAACAEIEEALRSISVGEDAVGMSYGILDAIAVARHEPDLSCAADILRDASADILDAALSALGKAGYAVVPKEPTRAMCERGRDIFEHNSYGGKSPDAAMAAAYAAMLSASQEQSDV